MAQVAWLVDWLPFAKEFSAADILLHCTHTHCAVAKRMMSAGPAFDGAGFSSKLCGGVAWREWLIC